MTSRLDRTRIKSRGWSARRQLIDVSRISPGSSISELCRRRPGRGHPDIIQQLEPIADVCSAHVRARARSSDVERAGMEQMLDQPSLEYAGIRGTGADGSRAGARSESAESSSPLRHRHSIRYAAAAVRPFQRLTPDHRRGGFGLGLWITRQIVNAHGGTVSSAANSAGIDLRGGSPASTAARVTLSPTTMPHPKSRNAAILIVDDDAGSRKALAEVLTDEGYSVATSPMAATD